MNSYDLSALLIVILPILSFTVLGLFGNRFSNRTSGLIGCASLVTTAILALYVAAGYFFDFGLVNGEHVKHIALQFQWLKFTDSLSIDLGIVLDPISVMMLLVITIVSSMVHIYSLGYMKGEDYFERYYAYLSLFSFSMLGLVVAVNIFQMYIFWELVGVSSFLLIGFYFTKPSAIAAAKKAFIVTRFADLGFLIGILMLSYNTKSLDFFTIIDRLTQVGSPYLANFTATSFMGMSALSWALLLVFMGGAGKSAMFPLHIWLPDAMEGPTPVSALIHAATMVVAGVFLVARLFPVFAISAPDALLIIAYIGAFTALFAAVIACTQTDIKRVLAYSTISQIAYMMFALGVAGWGEGKMEGFTASMFHLFTHAFFKALLFLGAGAVIHAVHTNEMEGMGGLRKSLPITHFTFLIACLAIAGVPPFAGFFSKEAILSSALQTQPLIFYVGLFTSGLTAFYMFRLYFRIFWYNPVPEHSHNHETHTWAMNIPLIILGVGAAFAGLIPFGSFVSADGKALELPFHLTFSIAPVAVGLIGIGIAYLLYGKKNEIPDKIASAVSGFYQAAYHKFYIDEIYLFITKKVLFNLVGRPAAWFDRTVVNGLFINGSAETAVATSNAIKPMQSGRLQSYTMFFLGGVLLLAALLIIKFM
ncbi:MAG: nuoL [Bacteroidetes bacterium]|jgi:NADH-quinone oxidoreductase subunit L|nr:nuoL [Bacteroidota bacterium]